MKKLYLDNGSKQFKFADTTTKITMHAFDNGTPAKLSSNTTVRIKNSDGYLLGITGTIDSSSVTITSGQLSTLPIGSYLIELWDTVDGGTAIYPSNGFLALQINQNITDLSGNVISSITVDDFIQQFSDLSQQLKKEVADAIANGLKGDKGADGLSAYQVAVINGYKGSQTEWLASLVGATGKKGAKGDPGKDFRIVKTFPSIAEMNGDGFSDGDFTMIASDVNDPDDGKLYVWNGTNFTYVADLSGPQGIKGDTGKKGDTGSVDNDGLIKAPAFVNLQTQVNNSAVGANLIVQSDLKQGYIRATDGSVVFDYNDFHSDNYIPTNGGTVFTFSSPDYVFKGSNYHYLIMYDSDKKYLGYQNITSATQTLSKSNAAYIKFSIHFLDEGGTYGHVFDWLSNHRYKLEKGGVVTDWCLNPTDILTQSDYEKIQAAIVALGGSLS